MAKNHILIDASLIIVILLGLSGPSSGLAGERAEELVELSDQPFPSSYSSRSLSALDNIEAQSVTQTSNAEPSATSRRYVAHSLLAAGFLGYLTYGYFVFWDDVEYQKFYMSEWNDTYQRSYAGGSDKISHAFGGYLITRTVTQLYSWAGVKKRKAALFGFGVSQTFLLIGEIEDGFTLVYGFDPVDFAANLAGGALGFIEELYPRFDECFDFRFSYWPSIEYRKREHFDNIAEDYSGLEFYFVGKFPEGLLEQEWKWLNFIEIYTGFRSRGYMPGYSKATEIHQPDYTHFYKERELLFGMSLDLRKVVDELFWKEKTSANPVRSLTNYFFEFYQHPIKFGSGTYLSRQSWYYP